MRGSYPQSISPGLSGHSRVLRVVGQTMSSLDSNQKASPGTLPQIRWISGTIKLAVFAYSRDSALPAKELGSSATFLALLVSCSLPKLPRRRERAASPKALSLPG